MVKINVIGSIPKTLKFTQISVDWVRHTTSFKTASAIKNPIQRWVSIFHPSSLSLRAAPRRNFRKGFKVGTEEYKNCIISKGKLND